MLVIVCGMPRSGSTLHYQIACAVVERTGLGRGLGWNWDALLAAKSAPRPRGVVKVHDPNPEVEATLDHDDTRFLYSFRDIRDAAASFVDTFGHAERNAFRVRIREWVRWFDHFASRPHVMLSRYEDFANGERGIGRETRRVADFLGAPLPAGVEQRIAESLTIERQRERIASADQVAPWDPVSLLHRNHIRDARSGKWKDRLSAESLAIIDEEAGGWLRRMGYETPAAHSV